MVRFFLAAVFALTSLFTTPAEAGWTPWVTLGGTITSDPAACTVGNYTYVVARGTDNRFYYRRRYLPTGIWDAWKMIPHSFQFSGAPGVTCVTSQGRPTVIVAGVMGDGAYYLAYVNDGQWTGWNNYGSLNRVGSGPALSAYYVPFQTHHFVRRYNNTLMWMYDGIGVWNQVGGYVSADPASARQSSGRVDLVLRARDGYLRHMFFEGGSWYGMYPVGGPAVSSGADMVSRAPGSLDLFSRGPNNMLIHKRWLNGTWGPWTELGGPIYSGPGATVYASNARMMVFARWGNGQLYYRAWAP